MAAGQILSSFSRTRIAAQALEFIIVYRVIAPAFFRDVERTDARVPNEQFSHTDTLPPAATRRPCPRPQSHPAGDRSAGRPGARATGRPATRPSTRQRTERCAVRAPG